MYVSKVRRRYCSILSCDYFKGCAEDNVSFFRIPTLPAERQKWIDQLSKHQRIEPNPLIFQLHFEDKLLTPDTKSKKGRLKLTPTAVPTVFGANLSQPATIFEPIIKVEVVEYPGVARLNDDSIPQPKRQRLEDTPTANEPKHCIKCINLDVEIQRQKVKIEKLQDINSERSQIIKTLQAELAIYKSKFGEIEAIAESTDVKCSVCLIKYSSYDRTHICDGRKVVSCDYCCLPFNSMTELVDHLTNHHHEKQFFKCDKCPRMFSMYLLLQFHSKCHPNVEAMIECDACDTKCHTQYQLKMHKEECHSDKVAFKPFQCGKCGKCFTDATHLQKHMKRIHNEAIGNTFECYICKVKLKSLHTTRIHLKLHERPEKCAVCFEHFTMAELEMHLCNGLKTGNCEYCEASFKATTFLLKHLKDDCKGEKLAYKCDTCPKFYPMKSLRDTHTNQAHSQEEKMRQHPCDLCPKRFRSVELLKLHRKRHTMARDHLCDVCGKGFITLSILERHKLGHGERTFECEKCGDRFIRGSELKKHQRRVHEKNKFVCEICNMILASVAGLNSHKRIHARTEADRKYACTICPQKFFDTEHLHRHLRQTHSTVRPFECEICKQTYKYKGDLTKHFKLTHS